MESSIDISEIEKMEEVARQIKAGDTSLMYVSKNDGAILPLRFTGTGKTIRTSQTGAVREVERDIDYFLQPDILDLIMSTAITNGHPEPYLTQENYKQETVGHARGVFTKEGKNGPEIWLVAHLYDKSLINLIRNRPDELSTSPCVFSKEVLIDGVNKEIPVSVNHTAIVPDGYWDAPTGSKGIQVARLLSDIKQGRYMMESTNTVTTQNTQTPELNMDRAEERRTWLQVIKSLLTHEQPTTIKQDEKPDDDKDKDEMIKKLTKEKADLQSKLDSYESEKQKSAEKSDEDKDKDKNKEDDEDKDKEAKKDSAPDSKQTNTKAQEDQPTSPDTVSKKEDSRMSYSYLTPEDHEVDSLYANIKAKLTPDAKMKVLLPDTRNTKFNKIELANALISLNADAIKEFDTTRAFLIDVKADTATEAKFRLFSDFAEHINQQTQKLTADHFGLPSYTETKEDGSVVTTIKMDSLFGNYKRTQV